MRVQVWLAAVLVVASCGGESSPPAETSAGTAPAPASNSAPEVGIPWITPSEPVAGDELRLESNVRDPDGDPVEVHIEWFLNRELQSVTSDRFDTDGRRRGDEIFAVVRASDGSLEGVGQTSPVVIANSPPVVSALGVRPERPDASQTLVAEASVEDHEGDAYELHFEWLVNGKPVAGATGATLEPGHVKRGDKLQVVARASDADPGAPFESQTIVVANARPQIVSKPNVEFANEGRYEYQIGAKDPDGDGALRYSLVSGPEGMQVDLISGLVEWTVPSDADGKFEIEVAVRDAHGAEARQSYALELHWEEVPAKKSKPAKPADNNDY